MKSNWKVLLGIVGLSVALWACSAAYVYAQEAQRKINAESARQEEKALQEQMRQAQQSGDPATAKSLIEQIRSMHHENVQQKQKDQQAIQYQRQGMKAESKEVRQTRIDANVRGPKADRNNDGIVDDTERKAAREHQKKKDRDNNPPGAKGGPGTNWENKPGPQGGPGASPDHGQRKDRDNNPPGAEGGAGTNWENKPGPQGGAGASPDRKGGGKK
jgi:hypothetical protein